MHQPNFKPSPKELRLFALVLLIPAGIAHFGFQHTTLAIILTSYACLCLLIPTLARPLHHLLLLITWPIGFCLNHVLLAAIYYLLLTPIALVFKLRGNTPLNLQYPPGTTSNFSSTVKPSSESYYNPF